MDKKTIKAVLDVIKDVSDRPNLYGMEINGRYIYFSDGYVVVRLEMGQYENLRPFFDAHNAWVSGEQLKEIYKGLGARDVCDRVKNEDEDRKERVEWEACWIRWSNAEPISEPVPIRPETFKKLAPFGDMLMQSTENKMGQKLVKFNGKGINAFVCPLKGV